MNLNYERVAVLQAIVVFVTTACIGWLGKVGTENHNWMVLLWMVVSFIGTVVAALTIWNLYINPLFV